MRGFNRTSHDSDAARANASLGCTRRLYRKEEMTFSTYPGKSRGHYRTEVSALKSFLYPIVTQPPINAFPRSQKARRCSEKWIKACSVCYRLLQRLQTRRYMPYIQAARFLYQLPMLTLCPSIFLFLVPCGLCRFLAAFNPLKRQKD